MEWNACYLSIAAGCESLQRFESGEPRCLLLADFVEKVGFSAYLTSGTTTLGEPTHHIEWFLCPSLTIAVS